MNALERLHKTSIRATDVAAQYWCERQMELNYTKGPKITAEIRKGRMMHEAMEQEVNVPILLQPKSYSDSVYKSLYTSYMALKQLPSNGRAREIQVYGSVNGYRIVGKIDELSAKDGMVTIYEDKTKANDNLPSEPQMLSHKVQVLLYRKLVGDIKDKLYTYQNFSRIYGINRLAMTDEFKRQLDALGIEPELQSIDTVAKEFFNEFSGIKELSNTLCIRYINQFTGKEIKLYKFEYSQDEADQILTFSMKYWNGQRDALPVPFEEKWKCNYCVFFGKECKKWWPQKNL